MGRKNYLIFLKHVEISNNISRHISQNCIRIEMSKDLRINPIWIPDDFEEYLLSPRFVFHSIMENYRILSPLAVNKTGNNPVILKNTYLLCGKFSKNQPIKPKWISMQRNWLWIGNWNYIGPQRIYFCYTSVWEKEKKIVTIGCNCFISRVVEMAYLAIIMFIQFCSIWTI